MNSIWRIDQQIFLFFNSIHHPLLDPIMVFLSGEVIWIAPTLWMLYYIYKSTSKVELMRYALIVTCLFLVCDTSSSYFIKNLFERLRPCRDVEIKQLIHSFGQRCGGKYGFISSHASNSIAMIWFFLQTFSSKKSHKLLLIFPLVVSYSRLYLGVHYPLDLIAGLAWGIMWAQSFAYAFNNLRR